MCQGAGASSNNAFGASARFARSGVHGAYGAMARLRVGEAERYMAGEAFVPGAASATSERYTALLLGPATHVSASRPGGA